jgi:cytochrome c biogenesis protein CcmG/thiol:disulfide interchange protein DsbE
MDKHARCRSLEGRLAPELKTEEWWGTSASLKALRGRVVALHFWAVWCPPSIDCIPKDMDLVKKFADRGLALVSLHDPEGNWEQAVRVLRDKGVNYPAGRCARGPDSSLKAYALESFPHYVLIDRAGKVRFAGLTPDRVEDAIRILLDEPPPLPSREGEFDPDVYLGGVQRPAQLSALEGKPAPALTPGAWASDQQADAASLKGEVVVYVFFSPGLSPFADVLPTLEALRGRGVRLVGIADQSVALTDLQTFAKAAAPGLPIMLDARVEGDAHATNQPAPGAGATARAFGVRLLPAVVVTDRSGIVRAAGVEPKKLSVVTDRLLAESPTSASTLAR